jgi:signal peptidase II
MGAAISAAVLVYALRGGLRGRPELAAPLALVAGGSLANLLDRLRLGAVVDFIDVHVWPVFNVADAAITAGAAWLAVRLLLAHRRAGGA